MNLLAAAQVIQASESGDLLSDRGFAVVAHAARPGDGHVQAFVCPDGAPAESAQGDFGRIALQVVGVVIARTGETHPLRVHFSGDVCRAKATDDQVQVPGVQVVQLQVARAAQADFQAIGVQTVCSDIAKPAQVDLFKILDCQGVVDFADVGEVVIVLGGKNQFSATHIAGEMVDNVVTGLDDQGFFVSLCDGDITVATQINLVKVADLALLADLVARRRDLNGIADFGQRNAEVARQTDQ